MHWPPRSFEPTGFAGGQVRHRARPGDVPSALRPSGFRASKVDLDVCSRTHSPSMSGESAGSSCPGLAARAIVRSATCACARSGCSSCSSSSGVVRGMDERTQATRELDEQRLSATTRELETCVSSGSPRAAKPAISTFHGNDSIVRLRAPRVARVPADDICHMRRGSYSRVQ